MNFRRWVVVATMVPSTVAAQQWNSPRVQALVEHATERRAAQLADTALRSYEADARGYLTFLAQVGEGFPEPPKIVKADQIALDVYWRAPNLSRQLMKGRRDTLLLPTDIRYHRDHLGIVQNNFPSIIRLGEGDEVEDVPHPLSAAGLAVYDYAIRDSLQIRLGPRVLDVYEVRVRPKDDRAPRAIGSVYIDRESGDVVRMTLSFTRAALKDKDLEDVSIVLENGLIDGRFWLPRRQEIEIRRTGTWLDYPARGIIRGRWEIENYRINVPISPLIFASGPEIVVAPGAHVASNGDVTSADFTFSGHILDSLPPDVRVATDEDVAKVQSEARALVRGQALARSRTLALSARRVSDFVHVNRVEGLALGIGAVQQLGSGFSIGGYTSYGTADHVWTGRGTLAFRRASGAGVELSGYDVLQEASDVPETSLLRNTFAAQEFGSDYTDPYGVRGASIALTSGVMSRVRTSADFAYERQRAVAVHATPAAGTYEPTIPALALHETRFTLGFDIPTHLIAGGFEASGALHIAGLHDTPDGGITPGRDFGRVSLSADVERPFTHGRLMLRTVAAGVAGPGSIPAQHLVYLGGPTTGPGYDFHSFVGRLGVSQHIEWQTRVPFVAVPLGAFGRAPATLTLAPFAHVVWIDRPATFRTPRQGWYPSVGVGALTLFDLLRFDVARGLRDGRWTFSVDVSRDFWSVL